MTTDSSGWWIDEEEEKTTPRKIVGITYKNSTSALYCEDWGNEYHVINGGWEFDKDTGRMSCREEVFVDYRIVIPDMTAMKFNDAYNEACFLIMDAAEKIDNEVPEDIRGFVRDGAGTRNSTLVGAWTEIAGGGG